MCKGVAIFSGSAIMSTVPDHPITSPVLGNSDTCQYWCPGCLLLMPYSLTPPMSRKQRGCNARQVYVETVIA